MILLNRRPSVCHVIYKQLLLIQTFTSSKLAKKEKKWNHQRTILEDVTERVSDFFMNKCSVDLLHYGSSRFEVLS